MYSELENYLSEVAAQLQPLPVQQRNEELREMRQHLLNAEIVNREMGQSEEQAAATAIEQFGPPEELTRGLIRAWRQGEQKKNVRYVWRMTALFAGIFLVEDLLRPHVIVPMIPMIVYGLVIFAWRRLAQQNPPTWWTYQRRPMSLAQCWLSTASYAAGCLLFFLTVPHSLMQARLLGIVTVFTLGSVWAGRLRVRRRGDDGPTGPLLKG